MTGIKNKSEDLRNHLFATLEALQDDENPMDIERAKVVGQVADRLINMAKVEIDYIRATGAEHGSDFLEDGRRREALPPGKSSGRERHESGGKN